MDASTKAFLNLVKASLAPEVKNNLDQLLKFLVLEVFTFLAWIYFFNFAVYWLLRLFCASFFSSRFSTWIFLPSYYSSLNSIEAIKHPAGVIFSMKVSEVVSLLNPQMNYWQKLANLKKTHISHTDWGASQSHMAVICSSYIRILL